MTKGKAEEIQHSKSVSVSVNPAMIEAGAEVLRFAALGLSHEAREVAEDVLLAALPLLEGVQTGELLFLPPQRS